MVHLHLVELHGPIVTKIFNLLTQSSTQIPKRKDHEFGSKLRLNWGWVLTYGKLMTAGLGTNDWISELILISLILCVNKIITNVNQYGWYELTHCLVLLTYLFYEHCFSGIIMSDKVWFWQNGIAFIFHYWNIVSSARYCQVESRQVDRRIWLDRLTDRDGLSDTLKKIFPN